jgi:serine/threonine-protein kinase
MQTGHGVVLGSPQYMAPEQGAAWPDIDHRVDIWALGIVLYEALSGVRPIDGANFGQVLNRLLTGTIPPLEALEPDLPAELTRLVGRMLARDRDERPDDLREVAEILRKHTEVEPPSFGPARTREEVPDDVVQR